MSKYLRIISDINNDSINLIKSIKSEADISFHTLNQVAYAKDTSAMYRSIKSCYGQLTKAIENSAHMKRTLLSFEEKDYKKLYNAPFLYQKVEGSIDASINNRVISGTLYLYNRNGYTLWDRQEIGIEARITFVDRDKTNIKSATLSSYSMCITVEPKVRFEHMFSFDINNLAKETDIKDYEAIITLIPFIKYDNGTMYFTDITSTFSYIQYSDANYDSSNNFKIKGLHNETRITDYINSSVSELTIPNIITKEE